MTASASPLRCFHPGNLLTYASLLAALGAIACAGQRSPGLAGALIAVAVILDTFDGRFARLFARDEDQRASAANSTALSTPFRSVSPRRCACCCYGGGRLHLRQASADRSAGLSTASAGLEVLWWVSVFVFVACAVSRLAFYNVSHEQTEGFIGLPAPVAALIWATVLLLNPGIAASTAVFTTTAVAMVLPLPIPRPQGLASPRSSAGRFSIALHVA